MELFATIISGVGVLVLGELLQKLWLEPLKDLRKQISSIIEVLTEYESLFLGAEAASAESLQSASMAVSKCAIKLRGKTQMIPLYSIARYLYKLPNASSLNKAVEALNAISNFLVSNRDNKSIFCHCLMLDALRFIGFEIEASKKLDEKQRPHF